jgi:transposase-like protein
MIRTKIEILLCTARGMLVGLSNRMARHPDDVVTKAREMYASGMGYRSIGKALNVPRSTVQSWIGKSGTASRNVPAVRIIAKRVDEKE